MSRGSLLRFFCENIMTGVKSGLLRVKDKEREVGSRWIKVKESPINYQISTVQTLAQYRHVGVSDYSSCLNTSAISRVDQTTSARDIYTCLDRKEVVFRTRLFRVH